MKLSHLDLDDRLLLIARASLLLLLGWLCAQMFAMGFARLTRQRLSMHHMTIGRRAIFYLVFLMFLTSSLHELGIRLSTLMGAAGILTVAVGFASQTSASNLISGLFLLGEGSFALGDWIQVGSTLGEVLSIDLLSVKLRTVNNLYVRLPNEILIKSEVTNISRFPIRRLDVKIGVAYKENLGQVRQVLLKLAQSLPHSLDEPAPSMQVEEFAASSINLVFSLWVQREHYAEMLSEIHEAVKNCLDEAGIEIPFNQLVVQIERSSD